MSFQQLFIWIDILGFSDALEDDSKYSELSNVLKVFRDLFITFNPLPVSDGVLLTLSLDDFKTLSDQLANIAELQFKFTIENTYFVRGGMAVGTKFEADFLISNGFARAVKSESQDIDWPVIGTKEETIRTLREYLKIDDPTELFGMLQSFNKKGESLYYLNFLPPPTDKAYLDYRDILKRKLDEFRENPQVHQKYVWLQRYYYYRYGRNDLTSESASISGRML